MVEAISVSGPQPVGLHVPKLEQLGSEELVKVVGETVQPQSAENRSAPSPLPPANSNAPALVSKSTASIQTSTRVTSSVSQLRQESPLRGLLQQLTALELQAMILNLLLGNKDEDSNSTEKLLVMALLGLLLENRDPRSALHDGQGSAVVGFSQITTQNAVAAYTEARQMPETTTAGSTGTQAAPTIDTKVNADPASQDQGRNLDLYA